jgi:ribokinase
MAGQPRIAVVGSANMDLTTFADHFPEPGETVFGKKFQLGFGGKGANQAVAARLCGAHVSMVGRVGDDLFGSATIANFRSHGIDTSYVSITPGVATGVAPIFVDSAGQNRILVVKGANESLAPSDISAAGDALRQADCILLQLEIPLETVYYTLDFARQHGVRCILNPAPAQPLDIAKLANVDYFIPNETEAGTLSGLAIANVDDARTCALHLLRSGLRRVIITMGANGSLRAGPDGMEQVMAYPTAPLDTSGAGDAFIGSFASFLAQGYTESESVARANLYAALSTLSVGTQTSFVSRDRLEAEWTVASR